VPLVSRHRIIINKILALAAIICQKGCMDIGKAQPALAQFIRENGLKRKQFAKKIGTSESVLSRWINGAVVPRRTVRAMIEIITEGQVIADEWQ
jgi:DNA-binding transcriptional regulator YiaG